VLGDNELMIHSHHVLVLHKYLLDLYLTFHQYYNNMKSSNNFVVAVDVVVVFVDVLVKDDGYIHASPAVDADVVVEVDTTFIYTCAFFFFFLFQNFKSVV
jgi:hypothetical protein